MTLMDLGHFRLWSSPHFTKRVALERCLERETDPNKIAALNHALGRAKSAEILSEITKELSENT